MKCCICNKPVTWIRFTQFAGEHLFCTEHALKEDNFGSTPTYDCWHEVMKYVDNSCTGVNPIALFTRPFGCSDDNIFIDFKSGICTIKQLETWIEEAKDFHVNKLHRIFNLLKEYSIEERRLSPETSEFDLNLEKIQDAINLGVIDRQTVLDMECMKKERFIVNCGEFFDDFFLYRTVKFSFMLERK